MEEDVYTACSVVLYYRFTKSCVQKSGDGDLQHEHFVNIEHAGCVFHYERVAWIDGYMDDWRRIYLRLTQQSYIIGLPRIVFSG